MQKTVCSLFLLLSFAVCYWLARPRQIPIAQHAILSVTMNLSAFGVESDIYPSIAATLNFEQRASYCKRSYYNPAYPTSTYRLSAEEISQVKSLLQQANLAKLKSYYSVGTRSDQPTPTIIIRTSSRLFTIKDYGLEGAEPLPEIYRIVYKLEY